MTVTTCVLIGAASQAGASQRGCLMGPDALRTAGLCETLAEMGIGVRDLGNLGAVPAEVAPPRNPAVRNFAEVVGWTRKLGDMARETAATGAFPIFLGGDHSISAGSVAGLAAHASGQGRPLSVLWLDAHSDLHSPDTSETGHLHGTPAGYFTGQPGFEGFPALPAPVPPERVCFMGLRSVDAAEKVRLAAQGFVAHDMRAIDETGVVALLRPFLEQVRRENGWLHVSLDVDFLDPEIAPAVGTTVPGGATVREAHLIMEMVHESGLAGSLDLVELNPFLDERGRTARLLVDLAASLFGRSVLDRPTRSY